MTIMRLNRLNRDGPEPRVAANERLHLLVTECLQRTDERLDDLGIELCSGMAA